jgi:hypothetical protein
MKIFSIDYSYDKYGKKETGTYELKGSSLEEAVSHFNRVHLNMNIDKVEVIKNDETTN